MTYLKILENLSELIIERIEFTKKISITTDRKELADLTENCDENEYKLGQALNDLFEY